MEFSRTSYRCITFVTALGLLLAAGTSFAQRVRIDRDSVAVSGDPRSGSVITSTLAGVGAILAEDLHVQIEDMEVVYDSRSSSYLVRSGNELHVELDARTGRYQVHVQDRYPRRSLVVNSLSGAGAVITGSGGQVELSKGQVDAMAESWQVYGMSDGEVQVQLRNLESLGVALDEMGYALDEMGRGLDEMGRRLDESFGGRSSGGGGAPPPRAGSSSSGNLRRTSGNITCESTDEVRIENRTIEVEGVAIFAQGVCEIWVINSQIISLDDVAIVAMGRAEVHIEGSTIVGRRASVDLSGKAVVDARGTDFTGRMNHGGKGEFVDGGGNTFK